MLKALRFFIHYGWKYDKLYVVEKILCQLTRALVPLAAALLPKLIIDELMGSGRPERLALFAAALAGYIFLSDAVSEFLDRDAFSHRLRVDAEFGLALHARQARADLATLEDPAWLDLRGKAEKFITCDYHGFGYLLDCALDIGGQAVSLVGLAVLVFSLNGWLVPLFAALSALAALAELRAKKKAMALYDGIASAQRGWTYYAGLFADFRFGKEIRLNGIGDWLTGRERRFCGEAIAGMKAQNDLYICAGVAGAACRFIQQGAAYALLCAAVLRGKVGIGDFAMLLSAVTALGAAIHRAMNSAVEIRAYDQHFGAVEDYLNTPARLREGEGRPLPDGPRRVEFRDVGFRYPGQEKWALRHVNLTLEPGEKLAVAGENGAGKTTFVKLLTRLYDPTEGQILLDGVDIRALDIDAYRSLFGAVFQDYKLFSFSLKDNVALGRAMTDAEAEALLRRAGLGGRLDSLPKGVHSYVNREFDEHGFEPSGGEAQKIALARALGRQAPILVLDEPTAALDPRSEYEMYARLSELTAGRAAVFISHRLASARLCDRVAVFAGGALAECDTHAALMAKGGEYAALYGMQARYYE